MSPKRDTKALIKSVSLPMFARNGICETSIRDIADAASISPSNIYSHYSTKEALVDDLFSDISKYYGGRAAALLLTKDPFLDKLDRLAALICELHDRDTSRFHFLMVVQEPKLIASHDSANPLEILRKAIDVAMAHHEIGYDDSEIVAASVMGVFRQAAVFAYHGRLTVKLQPYFPALLRQCHRLIPPLTEHPIAA